MARWNVNIEHDAVLDGLVPVGVRRVCDLGTGDGLLAGRLARRVPEVVAVDLDAEVLRRARAARSGERIAWMRADVLRPGLPRGVFDAVVSNATLHHLPDAAAALAAFAALLAPGGTLAVVTFVRPDPWDWPWLLAGRVRRELAVRRRGWWEHSAPVCWPPRASVRQVRAAVSGLAGARVRRLPYGCALVTWTAPGEAACG